MKRILLILLFSSVLPGCAFDANEISFSEVNIDEVSDDVERFINEVSHLNQGTGNGIYMYNHTDKRRYLYLSQEFLDEGRDFGDIELRPDGNSINIYLSDRIGDDKEPNEYKLYKINLDMVYEYMKVYKNEEETHFQSIGI